MSDNERTLWEKGENDIIAAWYRQGYDWFSGEAYRNGVDHIEFGGLVNKAVYRFYRCYFKKFIERHYQGDQGLEKEAKKLLYTTVKRELGKYLAKRSKRRQLNQLLTAEEASSVPSRNGHDDFPISLYELKNALLPRLDGELERLFLSCCMWSNGGQNQEGEFVNHYLVLRNQLASFLGVSKDKIDDAKRVIKKTANRNLAELIAASERGELVRHYGGNQVQLPDEIDRILRVAAINYFDVFTRKPIESVSDVRFVVKALIRVGRDWGYRFSGSLGGRLYHIELLRIYFRVNFDKFIFRVINDGDSRTRMILANVNERISITAQASKNVKQSLGVCYNELSEQDRDVYDSLVQLEIENVCVSRANLPEDIEYIYKFAYRAWFAAILLDIPSKFDEMPNVMKFLFPNGDMSKPPAPPKEF